MHFVRLRGENVEGLELLGPNKHPGARCRLAGSKAAKLQLQFGWSIMLSGWRVQGDHVEMLLQKSWDEQRTCLGFKSFGDWGVRVCSQYC